MTTIPALEDVCLTCGKTYGWHIDNQPRHPFNHGQDGATAFLKRRGDRPVQRGPIGAQEGSEGPQIASMTTDPVLRIALINKGILTPTDLAAAEEALRVALAEVKIGGQQWSATGEASSDSSTETGRTSTEH
jgi:hypothetical protein